MLDLNLYDINWTTFIWELSKKSTSKYTSTTEKTKWEIFINYELLFLYMWGSNTIRCNENVYNSLIEKHKYILPIWQRSFIYEKWTKSWIWSFVRNLDIIDLTTDEKVFIDVSKSEDKKKDDDTF